MKKSNNNSAPLYIIGKKRISQVYDIIHEKIMDARIGIATLLDKNSYNKIDHILHRLNMDCPEQAIDKLKKSKKIIKKKKNNLKARLVKSCILFLLVTTLSSCAKEKIIIYIYDSKNKIK